jgi:hypothetical protein
MSTKRLILTCLVALLALASASIALAGDDEQIAVIHEATARYHRVEVAMAEGYGQFLGCVSEPSQGAMGIHFVNGNLVGDTVLDPARPEAVIYEPWKHGKLRLVAVEYVVFQEAWDAENPQPPSLFGHTFHLVGSPNRYGIPAFYELHVWAWKHNPSGLFNDWNPNVSCP